MALDQSAPRTRRAMLAAGAGGLLAAVATTLGRPASVNAADGENLVLGQANTASTTTTLTMATSGDAFKVVGPATASAISGESPFGAGVSGRSVIGGVGVSGRTDGSGVGVMGANASLPGMPTNMGVYGFAATNAASRGVSGHSIGGSGTVGLSGDTVPTTAPAKVGVYGYANQDTAARGVLGQSAIGTGVQGRSDSGNAVSAISASGQAVSGVTTSGTAITGTSNSGPGIVGKSQNKTGVTGESATFRGVHGKSTSSTGVRAESDSGIGLFATSVSDMGVHVTSGAGAKPAHLAQHTDGWTAVQGFVGSTAPSCPEQTGVHGHAALSANSVGIFGSSSEGMAVAGVANDGYGSVGIGYIGVYGTGAAGVVGDVSEGTGVMGWSGVAFAPAPAARVGVWAGAEPGRTALQVKGVARFDRSGKTTLTAGQASKRVTVPGGISTTSFGLAVLQAARTGVYVRAVVPSPANGWITIYLNKAVTVSTVVGWQVIG